jgi:hypothetical protein
MLPNCAQAVSNARPTAAKIPHIGDNSGNFTASHRNRIHGRRRFPACDPQPTPLRRARRTFPRCGNRFLWCGQKSEDVPVSKIERDRHVCLPHEPFSPLQLSFTDSAAPAAIILSVLIIQRGMLR